MTRFTKTNEEAVHLTKLVNEMPFFGILHLTLNDGRQIEGLVRGSNMGNNAGKGGQWAYYGEVKLLAIDKQEIAVDYLDIRSWKNVWSSRHEEYERCGLVQIVNFPGQPPLGKIH